MSVALVEYPPESRVYPADSLESEPAELLGIAVGDCPDQRREEPAETLAVHDVVADGVGADPGEEGRGEEEALVAVLADGKI